MVKRVNERKNCIVKLKKFFKIDQECVSEEDIVGFVSLGDHDLELLTINLIIDKMIYNKNFILSSETYKQCKEECSNFFN